MWSVVIKRLVPLIDYSKKINKSGFCNKVVIFSLHNSPTNH